MPAPNNISVINTKPEFTGMQKTKATQQVQSLTYNAPIQFNQPGVFYGGSDRRDGPAPLNIGVIKP